MGMVLIVIAAVIVVAVGIVLLLAAGKPDVFRVQRSTSTKAAAEKVFPYLNDFHQWPTWSPWEKFDPAMKKSFSGSEKGSGAIYEWDGNKKVGKGRMEILESSSPGRVKIKLDFLKPFEGHNTAEFTMTRNGDSTEILWAMEGPVPFAMKIFHVFMNMDKLIGRDFEAGLANLKAAAEK